MKLLPRNLLLMTFFVSAVSTVFAAPFPEDMMKWDTAEKDRQREAGKQLLDRLEQARVSGEKSLTIPKGAYRFAQKTPGPRPTYILLKEFKDITLDFSGSDFFFDGNASGIVMTGCRNVTIKNVKLDWDPLPFTQGVVESLNDDDNSINVKIESGYEVTNEGLANLPATGDPGLRGIVFDKSTRMLKPGQQGFALRQFWQNKIADHTYRIPVSGFYGVPLKQLGIDVGDPFVILRRTSRAIRIEASGGITLEDVDLYSSPFVCIAEAVGDGGTVYRRTNIIRRPGTNRLIAGNADGFNVGNCKQGPLIDSCKIEFIGDDFVNVHGNYARVLWQESPNVIIASRLHVRSKLNENIPVDIYSRDDYKLLGQRKVVKAEMVTWELERNNVTADLDHKWHSGEAASLAWGKKVGAQRLTLDSAIDTGKDAILISDAYVGGGAVIRDCNFVGSIARGIRLQSYNTKIENNIISNTLGPAVTLSSQPSFWGEGTNCRNVTITGNTFMDNCLGLSRVAVAISPPAANAPQYDQHDIEIVGNKFIRPSRATITANLVKNLTIRDNTIEGSQNTQTVPERPGQKIDTDAVGYDIAITNSQDVVISGNKVSNPGKFHKGDIYQPSK